MNVSFFRVCDEGAVFELLTIHSNELRLGISRRPAGALGLAGAGYSWFFREEGAHELAVLFYPFSFALYGTEDDGEGGLFLTKVIYRFHINKASFHVAVQSPILWGIGGDLYAFRNVPVSLFAGFGL